MGGHLAAMRKHVYEANKKMKVGSHNMYLHRGGQTFWNAYKYQRLFIFFYSAGSVEFYLEG